jgi:hypothetical protein
LLRPIPGASRDALSNTLAESKAGVENIRGAGLQIGARYREYMTWANTGIRALRRLVSQEDVESLIASRGFWELHRQGQGQDPLVTSELVDSEIDERIRAFEAARGELDYWHGAFTRFAAIVIPDASVFIHHAQKLEEWDLVPDLGLRFHEELCLVVPIAVIDELDRLKENSASTARWRSAYSLAVIDRVVGLDARRGRLKEANLTPTVGESTRGEVWLQILFDPPQHERLPLADDEIVDRALALQGLTGREVDLLTFDTGQSTRARAAGVRALRYRSTYERGIADGSIHEPSKGN